ncbi:MAG: hypothetical protein HOF21_15850 [Nitrospina sp.]|jgi:hypothetical protein|nr:hypothetical protein [Nitrospina sp.]MBT5631695.1 hypothetical protein [Nitrospina sp.]
MNEKTETSQDSAQARESAGKRVDPILNHLDAGDAEVDKELIRKKFIDIWEYDKADELDDEEQFMTTVACFIYNAHNVLDDANIRIDRARLMIVSALAAWKQSERDKMIEQEKASENPFKKFIENQQPQVDDVHTWRHFLLEHKTVSDKNWVYKMKKCWFAQYFIRFGRTDYIQTACDYDKIPWEARKDYIDLKLSNLFAQLGAVCQFDYKPAKDK